MRFLFPWAGLGLLVIPVLFWLLRAQWQQRLGLDRAAFIVRALVLLALVVTLSGPQTISREPLRYIYFVVDRSASAALSQDDASVLQTLSQFVQPGEQTRYGLIVFGKEAFIDQPFSATLPRAIQTTIDPAGSNLSAALRLALETLPVGVRGDASANVDVVLLSDGQVDLQELNGVLEKARRLGVRIWTVPLGKRSYADVRIDSVQLPRTVASGQPFEGVAYVHSAEATTGTLLVYRDDELIHAEPLALLPGSNPVRFSDRLQNPGRYRYQVRIKTETDALLENNVAADLVTVSGNASLLIIERTPGASAGLAHLIGASGFSSDRQTLETRSLLTSDLAQYKAVVLDNISLRLLDAQSINALKAYVGQLGGGLWVIQGKTALAGVSNSPLEDLLPVTYEGPQREQVPGVAIIFVLDRSSSMGQSAVAGAGLTKLSVLKEAAAASIEVLREEDWIGVVTFDSSHDWIVPVKTLQDRKTVYEQLQQIHAGGGTDMLPPLREAFERLRNTPARIKHILVYSDGKTIRQDRDFESLFEEMRNSDVTVSSIGLGQQPDEDMLARLAEAGQGQLFLVRDIAELPKISVRETRRIVQRRWVIGDFQPHPSSFAQLRLSGLDISALPHIGGYVRTFAKPLSQTAILVEDAPLLSFWQYGLGQVAVLNTDLEGHWSPAWLAWPRLSALATEIVSQLYSNPLSNAGLVLRSKVEGSTLHLELDALDGSRWVNMLEVTGTLLSETGADESGGRQVEFTQIAPGRYVATVDGVQQGLNLLHLKAKEGEEISAQQTRVLTVPYPPEYQHLGIDEATLREIAERTHGGFIEDEQIDLRSLEAGGPLFYRDLWPWTLGGTLLLFLGDLLLRKIPLEALFMGK